MPTVKTIIKDLKAGTVVGVRKNLFLGGSQKFAVIAANSNIQFASTPVNVSIDSDNFLTAPKADLAGPTNGSYLHFEDSWSTVADITRASRIVTGGDYAGCLYSVFDIGNGTFRCVHTARPGGANKEKAVALLAHYAMTQGWRLVHNVPTVGFVGKNRCDLIYIITRVSYTIAPNPVVRTARVQLDQASKVVHVDRFDDA